MEDDLGTELAGWLRSRPTLAAMVDKDEAGAPRIHASVLPTSAGQTPRAIVYHLISDVSEGHVQGATTVSQALMQFDCYGKTPQLAARLRQRLKVELDTKTRGQIGNLWACAIVHDGDRDETETPIDGSEQHRFIRQSDYRISYQRATE